MHHKCREILHELSSKGEIVFLDEFSFAPKQKLEKRLKDILESDVDEKYYLSDKAIDGFKVHTQRMEERGNGFKFAPTNGDTIASSITTRAGGRPDDNFINVLGLLDCKGTDQIRRVYGVDGIAATLTTMQGGNQEPKIQVTSATKCGYETATTGDSINLSVPNSKTRRGRVGKQVAQTLDTQCNQAVVEPKIGAMRGRNIDNPSDRTAGAKVEQRLEINDGGISNCLTSVQKDNYVVTNRIRKLTPRECLRLQDFPDTFVQTVSDSQLYKQAGNSMSVNVLEMIFRQIDKAKVGESTYTLF